MDHITEAMAMTDHLPQPAFCVREGIIVKVNPAAAARMIEPGIAVSDLMQTGREEYAELGMGCLYLTLSVGNQPLGASVTRKQDFDLFLLEPDEDLRELQALALAARELRGPLADIRVSADLLFPIAEQEDEKTRTQITQLNRGLFQMHRLIGNMSDAIRYSTEQGSRQEVRDICAIAREILSKAAALAEYTGIRLEQQIHPEAVYSLVDAEKLERAILNIISNALKFTPGGESIRVSLTRRGNKLYFTVQDSGCGIPEDIHGDIFSRYTREPGLEDGRFGIGLGLVLIRSAAAIHGGTVLVDHPEISGTRVTMTLPIRSGEGNQLRSPVLKVDYAGELDHGLLEFADILPASLFDPKNNK